MTRSLFDRLDDAAKLTGIPQLSEKFAKRQHRRHLRWWSVVALVFATIGFVICWTPPHSPLGFALLAMIQGIAGCLSLFGPVKPWGQMEGVDERDIAVRRSAYLFAFAIVAAILLLGLGAVLAQIAFDALPRSALINDLAGLWLYALLGIFILPTLYASWATRPIEDE